MTTRATKKLNPLATALIAVGICGALALTSLAAPPRGQGPQAREIDDAQGECLSVPSRILGRSVPYCVILPPGYRQNSARRYPVLYYLHGLGDNEQMFLHSGGFDLVQRQFVQHFAGLRIVFADICGEL